MSEGRKFDGDKPDWSLMLWEQVAEVQEVLDFGAAKYARDNWKRVLSPRTRYFAAALRHILVEWWTEKSTADAESGKHPLAHAICCLLFLMWFDKHGKEERS